MPCLSHRVPLRAQIISRSRAKSESAKLIDIETSNCPDMQSLNDNKIQAAAAPKGLSATVFALWPKVSCP